jgi:hypothetical protein
LIFCVLRFGQEWPGFLLSHAVAFEAEAMGIVHDAIKNGVGEPMMSCHSDAVQVGTRSHIFDRHRQIYGAVTPPPWLSNTPQVAGNQRQERATAQG